MSNIRPLRSMLPTARQETFPKFADDLREVVQRYVPKDLGRYQKAAILGFDWSNDTMGVKRLREDFLRLLRTVYGFRTESYVLNANNTPQAIDREFRDRMVQFTAKHQSYKEEDKHLLVYYYSGHSDSGPYDQPRLGGVIDQNGNLVPPFLEWYRYSKFALSVPGCETLLILDSCNSAMAGIRPDGETLTAFGWESQTPANLASSFTQIMINEIKSLNGQAFTAVDLHAIMLTNALKNNMEVIPIHKPNLDYPSVLFHKIDSREAQALVRAPRTSAAKVLITVSISNDNLPDSEAWSHWLTTNMPTDIRDIEIMARWKAASCTILVSIPIQLWDYLKDNPAYNFVSFILGEVQVLKSPPSQSPPATTIPTHLAAVRPQPGPSLPSDVALRQRPASQMKENVRPKSSSSKR